MSDGHPSPIPKRTPIVSVRSCLLAAAVQFVATYFVFLTLFVSSIANGFELPDLLIAFTTNLISWIAIIAASFTVVTTLVLAIGIIRKTKADRIGLYGAVTLIGITPCSALAAPVAVRLILEWLSSPQFYGNGGPSIIQGAISLVEGWLYSNSICFALASIACSPIYLTITRKRMKSRAVLNASIALLVISICFIGFGVAYLLIPVFRNGLFFNIESAYHLLAVSSVQLSIAIYLLVLSCAVIRRRDAEADGFCTTCNYDLTGISSVCPECGTALTPQTS